MFDNEKVHAICYGLMALIHLSPPTGPANGACTGMCACHAGYLVPKPAEGIAGEVAPSQMAMPSGSDSCLAFGPARQE